MIPWQPAGGLVLPGDLVGPERRAEATQEDHLAASGDRGSAVGSRGREPLGPRPFSSVGLGIDPPSERTPSSTVGWHARLAHDRQAEDDSPHN